MDNNDKISHIISPCIRNCCLDEYDICLGCFRSISEIMQWSLVGDELRKKIIRNAALRKIEHKNKTKF
jgi:predicted Fe-S protein YdhL (DUF1289 family)